MIRPLVSALVVATLIGCKHNAPLLKDLPPPPVGNSGWTTAFDKPTGVSLALPPGWRVGVPRMFDPASLMGNGGDSGSAGADLNAAAGPAQEMGAQMMKDDAKMEKIQLAKMRDKEGIVLHCVDGSKPTIAEEPTRIYVKKIPDAGYGSLDDAAVAEKQDTHRDAKTTIVDLPIGKAARLAAQGQNRIGDVECHVSYVFLNGPDAYILRFASTNAPDAIMSIEKNVAQTFRVAKPK